MGQRVYKYSKFNFYVDIDKSKFVLKSFKVILLKPEAKWSNYEQVENLMVTLIGGLNSYL